MHIFIKMTLELKTKRREIKFNGEFFLEIPNEGDFILNGNRKELVVDTTLVKTINYGKLGNIIERTYYLDGPLSKTISPLDKKYLDYSSKLIKSGKKQNLK